MKQIGYIYKYSSEEKQGILVPSRIDYANQHYFLNHSRPQPILFYREDCLCEVHEDRLVYFDMKSHDKVTIFNEANLHTIDIAQMKLIVDTYLSINSDWERFEYSHILVYYDLDMDIYDETEDSFGELNEHDGSDSIFAADTFNDYFEERPLRRRPVCIGRKQITSKKTRMERLHKNLVREQMSVFKSPLVTIDLFNLDLWIDKHTAETSTCYGCNINELIDLYNIFIGVQNICNKKDITIAHGWKYLLKLLTEDELLSIITELPLLQPAMPSAFCLSHIKALSFDSWFPDANVCEKYFRFRISQIQDVDEYNKIADILYRATYCNIKHGDSDEGIPPCKMAMLTLLHLKRSLKYRFKKTLIPQIQNTWINLSATKDSARIEQLCHKDMRYSLQLAKILEILSSSHTTWNSLYLAHILKENYLRLRKEERELLESSYAAFINALATFYTTKPYEEGMAWRFHSYLNEFANILDEETIKKIHKSIQHNIKDITTIADLQNANEFLTSDMLFEQFISITLPMDIKELLQTYSEFHQNIPSQVIDYSIKKIIVLFDEYIQSCKFLCLDNQQIRNKEELVKWLVEKPYDKTIKQTVKDICTEATTELSKEQRWNLFIQGYINTPSNDNIREKLNYNYECGTLEEPYFRQDCFQRMMVEDILSGIDMRKRLLIIDELDDKHKAIIKENGSDLQKFYLWVTLLNDDNQYIFDVEGQQEVLISYQEVDLTMVERLFTELPPHAQIKLFKYMFFLKAMGYMKFSIDELLDTITCRGNSVCCYLGVICYLLTEKAHNLNSVLNDDSITQYMIQIEETFWHNELGVSSFLENRVDLLDFFFQCNGRLLLSEYEHDRYSTFVRTGVISKKQGNEKSYYIVEFYDYPIDIYGNVSDYSTWHFDTAKETFERNIPHTIEDGKYRVENEYEIELKEFVMSYNIDVEENCNLFNDTHDTISLISHIKINVEPAGNSFCTSGKCMDIDPLYGIPFYWCKNKPCLCNDKFLTPTKKWTKYKFIDLLSILLNDSSISKHDLWKVNSEVSSFLNHVRKKHYSPSISKLEDSDSHKRRIISERINAVRACWTNDLSIFTDISYYDEKDECDDRDSSIYEYGNSSYRQATYERYNGSYAQDEMGYSDDDIDTIFDGDPSAYWNID